MTNPEQERSAKINQSYAQTRSPRLDRFLHAMDLRAIARTAKSQRQNLEPVHPARWRYMNRYLASVAPTAFFHVALA
jgi:hypothetical protein